MDEHTYVSAEQWIEEQVPYEWHHVICTCIVPKYGKTAYSCLTCNKQARWQLHNKCRTCGQRYFGYYIHHASPPNEESTFSPIGWFKCFDCVVAEFGTSDTDVPPIVKPKPLRTLDEIFSDDEDDFDDFTF